MTEIRYVRVGTMCHDGKRMYVMFAIKTPVNPISLLSREQQVVFDWCVDQFGPPTRKRWQRAINMLGFRSEEDAVAFKIRWG